MTTLVKIYQMIRQAMLSPSTHAAASPVGHRLRRDSVADRKRPARSRIYGYRIYWLNSIRVRRLTLQGGLTQKFAFQDFLHSFFDIGVSQIDGGAAKERTGKRA